MRLERATYALAGIGGICFGLVAVFVGWVWADQTLANRRRGNH